jgi:hypothetical protein
MLTLDRAIGDRWLVNEGLNPGDRLIVEGSQKVRPGASVKVVPLDAGRKDTPAERGGDSETRAQDAKKLPLEPQKKAQPAAKAN